MTGKYRVKKTIYHAGAECVGLAEAYLAPENEVTILQKNREGNLKYPGVWVISGKDARNWPLKSFGGMPAQYFVPIEALKKVSPFTKLGAF